MLAGSLVARQVSLIATLAEQQSKVQTLKQLKAGVILQGAGSSRLVSLAIVHLSARRRESLSLNTCDVLVVVLWSIAAATSRRRSSVWTLVLLGQRSSRHYLRCAIRPHPDPT